jgi:hypothetical protein
MIVKRVAERAELNCGQCVTKHGNKCAQGPYCRHFFLHKSATRSQQSICGTASTFGHCRAGGHRDIKSTMVYLKGVQSKDALAKVNAGALARYVA